MIFLTKPDEVSPKESLLFSSWMMTLQLLKMGIPWDVIQNLSIEEVYIALGVEMAVLQKQQEEQARAQAQAQQRGSFKI